MAPRILVVTPVRNESRFIEAVARAMGAQTQPPERWIVVDDRSTDDTVAKLRALEPDIPFMTVLETPPVSENVASTDRLALAAEVRTFSRGLALDDWRAYTHVMKLDGDIELPPDYFERLMQRFVADPGLGLAGCALLEPQDDGGLKQIPIPSTHVHGAVKCYTRECFEAIGGIPERLGWDTIDGTYARLRGFSTQTFFDITAIHHRPFASADGRLRGRARHGECAYIAHYAPLWVLLRSGKVALQHRPAVISGLAFLYGYLRAAMRRVPRVDDPEFRAFTRRELRGRLVGGLPGRLGARRS
jgi:biofilm PGA synthesis N-glycosyltransferase PgaC